ncbi:hypothetical protein BGZ61DRAFT_353025 [Ilyonectria robusta]|uniref:uncharacterized protein n=1 Tax=Ilyonectria robusta TaxID=1079257 RepID=UPI001E8E794B|nr:uncharacterized protein BGZ61DRAFT_353025 [Ilyonectria robusta]KAH8688160.1 hypothetical protein BGZ61DRAFT_353025 [Ilyonectria robusta]
MDTRSGGWKPLLLSTPVLLGVAALSLILFAVIETLAQLSQVRGGLALSSSQDEIATYAMLSYLYVPTVVAVLFSMLWGWVDLDIKRIQPWIELSKSTGATAEDSILLDYPSDFIALAPIRAAKRRHWPVFLSGFSVVLIFWVMTPLQSALLGISTSTHTRSASAMNRSMLLPADEQVINMRYLNMAYAIGWLNQSYPAFTARDYALLPFYVNDDVDDSALSNIERNWTAETTKLWAEFTCTPATVKKTNNGSRNNPMYDFQGRGCSALLMLYGSDFNITVAYMDNIPDLMYNISSYDCEKPSDTLYSALVYWYKQEERSADEAPEFNITALHCDLSYHKQQVRATVTSRDLQPVDSAMEPLSKPTELSSEELSLMPYLRSLPLFQTASYSNTRDFVSMHFPEMRTLESAENISVSLNPIFRYSLAEKGQSVEVLKDPSKLQGLVQDVHKQLFSLAMMDRLTEEKTSTNDSAKSVFQLTGIVVSRVFAAVLEALLLLIAIAAGLVLYYSRTSACALYTNPSSIGQLLDIAHNSPDGAKVFRSMDTANEKLLASSLQGKRFQLGGDRLSKRNELITMEDADATPSDMRRGMPPRCYFKPIKPWVMRTGTGCAFAAVLVASIVVLSVLKAMEQKQNGLRLPSNNFEVLQLLENYIPTVIATLLESFWIFLTRTICIFQPFIDLCEGHSRPAKSIEATYASVPPQLALFKAIKSRHIMLALLCLAALLADVLAVSLSATFNEKPVVVEYAQEFQPLYESQFNNDVIQENTGVGSQGYGDFLAMTLANMSYNSPLSPWVSTDYFFLPHSIVKADKATPSDDYTVRTRGLGVDANCTSIPASTYTIHEVDAEEDDEGDTSSVCAFRPDNLLKNFFAAAIQWPSSEPATMMDVARTTTDDLSVPCTPPFSVAWARAPKGAKKNATMSYSYAQCQPILKTAMFDVTVNEEGYVLDYQRVGKIESTLNYTKASNHTKLLFLIMNKSFLLTNSRWRNNTSTSSWLSEFIAWETGSRDFLDPNLPVPDASKLTPVITKLYSRAFSAFLGVKPDFLEAAKQKSSITGTRSASETRIVLDNTAFIISITILCIDLVIALAYYLPKNLYILPRVPTTIGSVLSYIVTSRAVKDGTPPSGWKDQTFSFGRYVGYNGKSYVGIELDPFVLHRDTSFKKTGT